MSTVLSSLALSDRMFPDTIDVCLRGSAHKVRLIDFGVWGSPSDPLLFGDYDTLHSLADNRALLLTG